MHRLEKGRRQGSQPQVGRPGGVGRPHLAAAWAGVPPGGPLALSSIRVPGLGIPLLYTASIRVLASDWLELCFLW